MQPSAHLQSAIEIISLWQLQPNQSMAAIAKIWARSRRFAGSKDRSAIMDHVYQALRVARLAQAVFAPGNADPARAMVLGSLLLGGQPDAEIDAHCQGNHSPSPLSDQERRALTHFDPAQSAQSVRANLPEWLWPSWQQQFGAQALDAAEAIAKRSNLDVRINPLRANARTEQNLKDLAFAELPLPGAWRFSAISTRPPNLLQTPMFLSGEIEIQDLSSQIAVELCEIAPGSRVLDLCSGAGGKSLALASKMRQQVAITAFDVDANQQADLEARITRAGSTCITKITAGDRAALNRCGEFDVVLVDAPCTGSGTWRRHPDAKWRLQATHLQMRLQQQTKVLADAATRVRVGGLIYYWTCSLLPQENQQQAEHFLAAHPQFALQELPVLRLPWLPSGALTRGPGLVLAPHLHGCDGFYCVAFQRVAIR